MERVVFIQSLNLEIGKGPNEKGQNVVKENGVRVVRDLKSISYLCNTTLEFSGGLNGKGFYFNDPNAARTCDCEESFAV